MHKLDKVIGTDESSFCTMKRHRIKRIPSMQIKDLNIIFKKGGGGGEMLTIFLSGLRELEWSHKHGACAALSSMERQPGGVVEFRRL